MLGAPWAMSLPWRALGPHLPVPPPCLTLSLSPPFSLQDWLLSSDFSFLIQASALPRGSRTWGDGPQLLALGVSITGPPSPLPPGPARRRDAPHTGRVLPVPGVRQGSATSSQTPCLPQRLCGCSAGACCRTTVEDQDLLGTSIPHRSLREDRPWLCRSRVRRGCSPCSCHPLL